MIRLFRIASLQILLGLFAIAVSQAPHAVSGEVQNWRNGDVDLVLFTATSWPPPFRLPEDAVVIGSVASDGTFTFTLPQSPPEGRFVPVDEHLDPGCEDLTLTPPDATYFPIEIIAYGSDGRLIGAVFRGSPGIERGPIPPGYTVLNGYSGEGFTLKGSCPQRGGRVTENYDLTVEPGWYDIVQHFSEDPDGDGRIDRWVVEPVPDDAVWILTRPPG